MPLRKTSAWPLALTYAVLVVYASLYPFADWRSQGIAPWLFLTAAPPRYWTGFDIVTNVIGYAPLGFLLCLAQMRSIDHGDARHASLRAALIVLLMSLCMETAQSYLPTRVPSNLDLVLNVMGGMAGALVAASLEKLGLLWRWGRFRDRWFEPHAWLELVLLALWPVALLFPAPVVFGLGQVMERLEAALADMLADTPFLDWLPVRDVELQPLVPGVEMLCVMLGLLLPCLLGYSVVRNVWRRLVLLVCVVAAGVGVTSLSAALSYGPSHAWAWVDLPTQVGLVAGGVMALMLLPVSSAVSTALLLLALVLHMSMLNQAPAGAYFAQTLQTWEQGRFIRFHGLAQWLGWLWPYAALLLVLRRLSRRGRQHGR